MSYIKDFEKTYTPDTQKNITQKGTLYLVGTPIGNLSDISERALKVLSEVDFVAAEDTRNSGRLLSYFGIKKPMMSYFEHNKRERGEMIVERITAGEACALITDAGMPAISDPGEDIVRICAEKGVPVSVVPGPCAAVCALAMSGLFIPFIASLALITTRYPFLSRPSSSLYAARIIRLARFLSTAPPIFFETATPRRFTNSFWGFSRQSLFAE